MQSVLNRERKPQTDAEHKGLFLVGQGFHYEGQFDTQHRFNDMNGVVLLVSENGDTSTFKEHLSPESIETLIETGRQARTLMYQVIYNLNMLEEVFSRQLEGVAEEESEVNIMLEHHATFIERLKKRIMTMLVTKREAEENNLLTVVRLRAGIRIAEAEMKHHADALGRAPDKVTLADRRYSGKRKSGKQTKVEMTETEVGVFFEGF